MTFARSFALGAAAAIWLSASAAPGFAQSKELSDLANSQDKDRTQRLIEGAKKEGTLTLYSSTVPADMNPVLDVFKKKYGIEVNYWRSSAQGVLQRSINERNANRCNVDAFTTVAAELEALYREKLLTPVKTPMTADLLPGSVPAHGEWIGTRINIFAIGYNTNLVKKEDAPKSWDDFKKPIWKGKLAIEDSDIDWFATFVNVMGEEKGLALLREIGKTNGFQLRKGHTAMSGLVAAGDIPIALTLYNYKPEQLKKKGAPIEPLYLAPLIGLANGVAVSRCAPHPHAAVLFLDFMASAEGQAVLEKLDYTPTNPKVRPLPAGMKLTFVNPVELLDNGPKWEKLWDSTIVRPQ